MNKHELYEIVKQDLINRHGSYEVLGEEDEIFGFMSIAFFSVGHQDKFKSFTEWLLHLGLSDNDIMWVYTNLEK